MKRGLLCSLVGAGLLLLFGICSRAEAPAAAGARPVKVMIVNMFQLEAAPWLAALQADTKITVAGLSADAPDVHCTAAGICQMTTGMGHANAAASMMAVLFSPLLDLRKTYFLIAGIAGIDPERGTLGSAAWARYVVDAGLAHEIDARELPRGWQDGYFGVYTDSPQQLPEFEYKTELFQLDEAFLRKALALSQAVALQDTAGMQAYRAHYSQQAARRAPSVIQCDTLSSDVWWAGERLGQHARDWTRLLTQGAGRYCTSQQEDNATLEALTRASRAQLIDIKRIAVLRSGSDFDRPYANQNTFDSLRAQRSVPGAFQAATENLVRAGMPVVNNIVQHWDQWESQVPAN